MACFAATLGVLILSGFIHQLSAANKETCNINAAIGQSLFLPFVYNNPENTYVLKWTHNNTLIFYRHQGKVSVGKAEDISPSGSLFLKNLQFSSAGVYNANALHPNSTVAKTWSGRLCVTDKVPKPQLIYSCDFKTSVVNLDCKVAKPQGLMFSWTLDEKTLTSETSQKLSISLAQLKGERSFTCSVANQASKEKSDIVRPTCKSPSPSPPPLLCFKPKTVFAVAAGGGGLILLLLIIMLCFCHRLQKTQIELREKGELRMMSLRKREPDSISPVYETMQMREESLPQSSKPTPRICYHNVSEPEAPQLPTPAAEGQQPSPVPKPRMKNPQTSNS